jgi:hypothetical protein
VVAYTIERRADLSGKFVEVAQVPQSNLGEEFWIDTDVRPETFYGYRVRSVTAVGDRSAPSVISGRAHAAAAGHRDHHELAS